MNKLKNEQYTQDFNVLITIDFKKVNETIKKLQIPSELAIILQNEKIMINVTLSKISNIFREMNEFFPDLRLKSRATDPTDSETKITTIIASLKIFIPFISDLINVNANKLNKIITTSYILSYLKVNGFDYSIKSNLEIRHLYPNANLENCIRIRKKS